MVKSIKPTKASSDFMAGIEKLPTQERVPVDIGAALAIFNPELHGGELMADAPCGLEWPLSDCDTNAPPADSKARSKKLPKGRGRR